MAIKEQVRVLSIAGALAIGGLVEDVLGSADGDSERILGLVVEVLSLFYNLFHILRSLHVCEWICRYLLILRCGRCV